MSIGPDELLGVSSVHSYVPLVVLVEVASDLYDVLGAPCVECEAQADVRDEIVETLLAIQRRARKWESQSAGVFDTERKGCADVADGRLGDRPKASSVRPAPAPGR